MDAQVIWMIGTGGVFIVVGTAIGRQMTVRRDMTLLDKQIHKIGNKVAAFPDKPDEVYARKDVVAVELGHIRETLERIEARLERA